MNVDPALIARIVREEVERFLQRKNAPAAQSATPGEARWCGAPSVVPAKAGIQSSIDEKPAGNILALFLGSAKGVDGICLALRNLSRSGYRVTGYFSPSAQYVMDKDQIARDSELAVVLDKLPMGKVSGFVKEHQIILVPSLTRNTAAKLALAITDNPITYLLLVALGNKVPVLAGRDGMILDIESDCADCALDLPGMAHVLEAYERVLKEFGMRIMATKDLGAEMTRILTEKDSPDGPLWEGLLTAEDLSKITGSRILVGRKAVVTPLAADLLKQRGIEIVRKEK